MLAVFLILAAAVNVWEYTPLAEVFWCSRQSDQLDCMDPIFQNETETRGIDAAFATFTQLYSVDPSFQSICHYATHAIGQGAYQLYLRGDAITPLPQFSYCGYGFYHGFMIAMLYDTNDVSAARNFCSAMQAEDGGSESTLDSCLHGFGHGITELQDVKDWSDPLSVIGSELQICKEIGANANQQSMCAGGVFNSLGEEYQSLLLASSTFEGIVDPQRVYGLCEEESYEPFKEACFRDFNSVLSTLTRKDFAAAVEQLESIPSQSDAELAMVNYTDFRASLLQTDAQYQAAAAQCYDAPPYLVSSCILGYVEGLMEFGTPGSEYVRAIAMCESEGVRQPEKSSCFEEVAESSQRYSAATYAQMCASIPEGYRSLCASGIPQ